MTNFGKELIQSAKEALAMVDIAALDRLIESVEAGTATDFQFRTWRPGLTGTAKESKEMMRAYHGSLDAALALHEALLPGWDRMIGTCEDDTFEASVSHPLCIKTYDGVSPQMSRAWLLAILRAHRSQVTA